MWIFSLSTALLAAFAGAVLASLAVRRISSALALPLALVSVDQLVWNLATVGWLLTDNVNWKWVGAAASPMFVPFGFHYVLVFVGKRRSWRTWLRLHYGLAALLCVSALFGLLFRAKQEQPLGWLSAALALSGLVSAVLAAILLSQHLRRSQVVQEKKRGALLLFGLFTVTVFSLTDLLSDLGYAVPELSSLGSFLFHGCMGLLAFRFALVERVGHSKPFARAMAALTLVFCGTLALVSVGLTLGVVNAVLFLALSVGLGLLPLIAKRWTSATAHGEQLMRAAQLGRFSAQMGHDLKNPLAAAQGAIQFLQEEHRQGRSVDAHHAFLDIVLSNLKRVHSTVERYQRLSNLELHASRLALEPLITNILALQPFASESNLAFQTRIEANLTDILADRDLVSTALENLIQNALEAMAEQGGTLTVSAAPDEDDDGEMVVLRVADTGPGMNARTREQAFDPFFTTKATGSGLGLAWVAAVMAAHSGEVSLSSEEGRGTTVEMRFRTLANAP